MTKRWMALLLAALLCLSVAGCTASEEIPAGSPAPEDPAAAETEPETAAGVTVTETDIPGCYVYNHGGVAVVEQEDGNYLLINSGGLVIRRSDRWMDFDPATGIVFVSDEAYYELPACELLFTKEQMEANVLAFLQENWPAGELVSLETTVMQSFREGYASNRFRAVYDDGGYTEIYDFYALIDAAGLVKFTTPLISYTSGGGFPIIWTLGSCSEGLVQFTEEYYSREGDVELYETGYKDFDGNDVLVFSNNGGRDPEDDTVILYDAADVSHIGDFHDGAAVIWNAEWQESLIDRSGNLLFPFEYGSIYNDRGSYPVVYNEGEGWGFIDTAGQIVLPLEYDYAIGSYGAKFVVQKGEKCGVVDVNGNELVPFEYDAISSPDRGIVYAVKDGLVSIITLPDDSN